MGQEEPALTLLSSLSIDPLGIFDEACTGNNYTLLSEHYYLAQQQILANQTPTAAALCLQPGAVPIQIQDAISFHDIGGCYAGFYCERL